MIIRCKVLAPVLIVVFVIGLGGTMLAGVWKTESSKTPDVIKAGDYAGLGHP